MINKGLFTSNTPEWETPQYFFDELDKEFNFQLDVCATKENAKCKMFFTEKDDGLEQDWNKIKFEELTKNLDAPYIQQPSNDYLPFSWMNPPYGREIKHWVKKASEEGRVVALLPSRTDTRWFHDYIYKKENVEIRFIKGRLKFGGSKNSAPFPSMVVIFK